MTLFARRWLLSNTRGELAINLATELYYMLSRPLRSRPALRRGSIQKDWRSHFTTLGHDMSVHLLGTHLIPRIVLLSIGERARRAIAALPLPARLGAPRALLYFYDADLFLHARERWERVGKVEDLPGELADEDSVGELLERLERRIVEARSRPLGRFGSMADRQRA
jgi:hypothetical protein